MRHTLRLREQPAEPRALLERNILMYAAVVQRIITRLSMTEITQLVEPIIAIIKDESFGYEWLANAHVLAIGVRQIEGHLQSLKGVGFRTPEIEQAANQFLAACRTADVKNLRNLLEHQAEYIAGKSKKLKRHLVVDLKQSVSFGSDASGTEQVVWVSVFGRKCYVDRIVRAIAALEGALREGRQPLQEDGDATNTVSFVLIPGTPPLTVTFTEENARLVLEDLEHREGSVARDTVVRLLRQALQQREHR